MKNPLIFLTVFISFSMGAFAQTNVGIGNNAPLTKLDVSGAISVREGSALSTLSTGTNNNVALPLVPSTSDVAGFCRITAPTGGTFTITGIVPNTGANGQIITLINTTGKAMTIANAGSSSSAANRIYTQTGASLVDNASATANSSITMQYSQNAGGAGVAGWVVTATQNFITPAGTIVTNNVLAGSSSNAVSITNGSNQVVGGSNLTLNVAKNAVGQDGVLPGTATPANNNQVWGTNSSGVPSWSSVSNAQLANSAITVSNGTGISVAGSPVSLGGTVTVTNTGVTSVGMAMPGIFSVTGSPVTTTGTLTAALASESGNTVFAAPNGSAGTPTFRALVAADVPTLNQSTTGNASTATNVAISGLTAATATNTIDNLNYAQTWNWSTASTQTPLSINANGLSSGTALSLASTSTAGTASGISTLLNIARSGANAGTAHTAYGVYATVTNTNATSGTNVAGYFSASGATTANYGLLVAAGKVGIGTTAPLVTLDVTGNALITGANTNTPNTPISAVEFMTGRTNASGLVSGQTTADIAIQYGGGGYRHFIASRHNGATGSNQNAIDFYINNGTTAGASSAPGTNNTEVMSITEAGVGIATNAPTTQLQIGSSTFASNAYMTFGAGNGSQSRLWQIGVPYGNATTTSPNYGFTITDMGNSATPPFVIDFNTHNIGMGTTAPTAPLHIYQTGNTGKEVLIDGPGSSVSAGTSEPSLGFADNGTLKWSFVLANASGQWSNDASTDDLVIRPASTSSKILFNENGGNASVMAVTNAGVGFGVSSPSYPLQVEAIGTGSGNSSNSASSGTSWTGSNRWYNNTYGGGWSGWSSNTTNVGEYCASSLACEAMFISVSDRRVKKDFHKSESDKDLETINRIQITDYKMIDTIGKSDRPFKKVIAQQVESVYPQAVSTIKGFIPNIYTPACEVIKDGSLVKFVMDKEHGLKAGDRVKIYDAQWRPGEYAVLSADEMSFTVNLENAKDEYFVFGKQVNDFKSVDYDAISMLNVSATQEIAKRLKLLEAENERLKNSNASLQEENSQLKSAISEKAGTMDLNKLKAQVDDLKELMEKNGIRVEK